MAHRQQQDFCESVRRRFPHYFRDSFVLDVGSFDVNGNNQVLFENCGYIGVDLAPGRNVDICSAGHELGLPDATFDTVISTECAEHDRHFRETLRNMARMLKPGGLLVFTCATTGRPEHGTRRTTPGDAPPLMSEGEWADYYNNVTEVDFRSALDVEEIFSSFEFSINDETKDLYFWGTKAGIRTVRQDYSFLLPSRREADSASDRQIMALLSKLAELERRVDEMGRGQTSVTALTTRHEQSLLARGIQSTSLNRYVLELGGRLQDVADSQKSRRSVLGRGFDYIRHKVTGKSPDVQEPRKVLLNLFLYDKIYVLTPRHTTYVAKLIVEALADIGVKASIIHQKPATGYADSPHFVIAPQVFDTLPGIYVAFQMEQSISSRWFNKHYFDMLERAFAILDYSVDNIGYLTSNGLHAQQIYHMPLSCIPDFGTFQDNSEQLFDVAFYGDPHCKRRSEFLEELRKHFKVDTISEAVVEFVDVGDVNGMVAAISRLLEEPSHRESRLSALREFSNNPRNLFKFYFLRFLLGVGEIGFDEFLALAGPHYALPSERICLGLPEFRKRQECFDEANAFGFAAFPGLRHAAGWIGCGMSYKFIMLKAMQQSFDRVIVCEDDIEFLPGWESRFEKVLSNLESRDDWDIFAGLIADLHPDTKVLDVDEVADVKLAKISKMVSMVLNVYGPRAFDVLSDWNPTNTDLTTNTIDRFIEANGALRFVAAYPFLVGHRDDLKSTLWEFQNSEYNPLIERSSLQLSAKILRFEGVSGCSSSADELMVLPGSSATGVMDAGRAAE